MVTWSKLPRAHEKLIFRRHVFRPVSVFALILLFSKWQGNMVFTSIDALIRLFSKIPIASFFAYLLSILFFF